MALGKRFLKVNFPSSHNSKGRIAPSGGGGGPKGGRTLGGRESFRTLYDVRRPVEW